MLIATLREKPKCIAGYKKTREEAERIENKETIPKILGINMLIQKLDTCNLFEEEMNAKTQFGGNLSVRRDKNKERIILVGHNECIFRQYALTNKSWVGPQGQKPLHQKIRV